MTWADSRYMQPFYAVPTSAESVSALPTFASHAGIIDAHWNGLAEWQLFGKYRLGASASFAHLQGDAANSPITLRHEQTNLTGWLVHRFN
jgi:outer membrane protein